MFSLHGTSIQVVHADDQHNETEELAQDLMAINTVFICRQQGLRASANRKARIHQQQQLQIESETSNHEIVNNEEVNEEEIQSSTE